MNVTIEDVIKLHHEQLKTIGSKLLYLSIRDRASDDGWTALGLTELSRMTGLSRGGLIKAVKRLESHGLIEVKKERDHQHAPNRYRTIGP